MTRKDDMIAALQRRRPAGAVPIWELEFQVWDAASGRHVVLGHEFEALAPGEQEKAMQANAEILLSTARELCFAGLAAPTGYWHKAPGELAYYVLPGESRFRQLEILRELAPPDLMLTGNGGGVIGADYSEEFCLRMFEDPASIDEFAESTLVDGLQRARRLADCGAEAVISASDIADNSGPFFNPEQFRRWIVPFLDRWARGAHEMGLCAILHTDGLLPDDYVDAIAETELDALQAIDPVAGMDIGHVREVTGDRLCLCGNIDCGLLLMGTPQGVYDATCDVLAKCMDAGALVLGASNALQPETPMENYRAMIRAWRDHGQYAG
ncbi:MAG: uroporphyrinogen decarboxylase family protein [Planctomycetota bacterium]|jgi:hypothetical protein